LKEKAKAIMRSPILYIALIFLILPYVFPVIGGYTDLGTEIMIMALFALAYNMLLGHTGLMSFGHGAYFGIGAYVLGLTQLYFSSNIWICLLFGMLGAGLAAFLIGLIIIRKSGIYFGLLTVAFYHRFSMEGGNRRRGWFEICYVLMGAFGFEGSVDPLLFCICPFYDFHDPLL